MKVKEWLGMSKEEKYEYTVQRWANSRPSNVRVIRDGQYIK